MSNRVTLSINGRRVEAAPGTTILQAAQSLGIDIPTLCHDDELESRGICRLCSVEIVGRPRLEPACRLQVENGMDVRTDSDKVLPVRKMVLELLLGDHPNPCPTRASGSECKLCDYADLYGITPPQRWRRPTGERVRENAFISRDAAACILCSKCVRVCERVQGIGSVSFVNRGAHTTVGSPGGATLEDTPCEMCGNCTAVCPTGALSMNGFAGPVDAKVRTTCTYCGVGCQFDLNVRDERVVGVTTDSDSPVNGRWLCVKGRFGYEFINHPDRLTSPLIRRNGQLEPTTWDEALGYVASRLTEIKSANGPDTISFMSSSRCTNEENYLMEKLARAVIGTNNVDQCART